MYDTLDLLPDEIHLWVLPEDEIQDTELLDRYRRILARHELDRERQFYFVKDRRRYVATRALVRTTLSKYSGVSPAAWQFRQNAYGRPELSNGSGSMADVSFNVSHTSGLIICGVAKGRAIGVDTENTRTDPAPIDAASRYFSPEEMRALLELPQGAQHDRFFEYWTLKESYVKAIGKGLSYNLQDFTVDIGPDRSAGLRVHEPEGAAFEWKLWLLKPTDAHVVAVCVQRFPGRDASLVVRKSVPLVTKSKS